ncbi:MAG: hypothetical protein M5F18_13595 [Asgard group archaeon]|nr:hypothetical protein [Asgard group archaeon]
MLNITQNNYNRDVESTLKPWILNFLVRFGASMFNEKELLVSCAESVKLIKQ